MTLNRSFFLLTTAFLLMCTTAIALGIAFASEENATKPYVVGLAAGFLTLVILRFEGQRDLDAVLTLVIAFLAGLAMGVGIYLIAADRPGWAPKVSFGLCAVGAVALGIWSFRRQKTESPDFPNLLARSVDRRAIFESEGVQFTGLLEPAQGGKPHLLSILLQNCFDGPCEVTLHFDPAGSGAYMQFHPRHNVTLGAAEVVKVTLPVVTPTYPGQYPLYFSIEVKGQKGNGSGFGARKRPRPASRRAPRSCSWHSATLQSGAGFDSRSDRCRTTFGIHRCPRRSSQRSGNPGWALCHTALSSGDAGGVTIQW